MATLTWPRIGARLIGTRAAGDESVRRVGVRLAAQTIGLLLVMVIVLEVLVYVFARQAGIQGLEQELRDRAGQADPTACAVLRLVCGQFGPPGPGRGPGQPSPGRRFAGQPFQGQPYRGPGGGSPPLGGPSGFSGFNADLTPSEANLVYVDLQLHVVDHHSTLGTALLDKSGLRQAMRTATAQLSTQTYKGEDYLVYTRPLRGANGKVTGAAQTSISKHQYDGTMRTLLQELVGVALLGLVISGGISVLLVRRALQPIRLAIQRQRDFVADAAHELRTPLAIMRTVGEVGMAEPSADDLQATIAQMLGENQHLTRLVEDLSLLARTDTDAVAIDQRPVDLSSLVAETAAEIQPLAESQGVTLQTEVRGGIWTLGDLLRLRQLLLILLDNALKHTPEGGTVGVRLFLHGDRARLQVADSGPGIDPADLPRIFDRFYRADRARTGEGSGLGLAIGKWIVEAHGGQIQAANASPRGAVFSVTLPVTRAATVST
ncbi:MAG: hypothetical protein JOZ41_07795 [Chloroflexi bacterium]|nr:hypothetical protein [Chloroflexota bacterium]